MKSKILVSMMLALILTSCATTKVPVATTTQEFVVVDPDATPILNLKTIEWDVWNRQELADEAAKESNKDKVYYILTPEEATKLFDNLISISDLVSKSIENNKFYKKSIDEYRKAKVKAEKEAAASKEVKK